MTRELAKQLLALEDMEGSRAMPDAAAVVRVCEKLRRPLVTLAGAAGFNSLLSRAMKLTKQDCPLILAWEVKPDGSLQGVESAARQGAQVLVSNLLRLMFTLIGESLTLQLLRDVWQELPDSARELERQNRNE